MMTISLDSNGTWWVEDFRIEDSVDEYIVYDCGDKPVYNNDSFEKCLVWIWNTI